MVNYFGKLLPSSLKQISYRSLIPQGQCILCAEACSSLPNIDMCATCQQDLPWITNPCHRCALPMPTNYQNIECGHCLNSPPAWHQAIGTWEYQLPFSSLITGLKYKRQYSYGRTLTKIALDNIHQTRSFINKPELIIPTPLHWLRHWQRGFNQSALIAEHLSKVMNIPVIHAVKRIRATKTQLSLNAQQRRKNLKGAFSISHHENIKGKSVILVDDVMTTGATAHEITNILLKAGAKEITIWVLARTVL